MSSQDPRSDKVAKLCEMKDIVGSWKIEGEIDNEDYRLLKTVLNEAIDNPSEWQVSRAEISIQNEFGLASQNSNEVVIFDLEAKTYIWSQGL